MQNHEQEQAVFEGTGILVCHQRMKQSHSHKITKRCPATKKSGARLITAGGMGCNNIHTKGTEAE